jgi:hypothetical protein
MTRYLVFPRSKALRPKLMTVSHEFTSSRTCHLAGYPGATVARHVLFLGLQHSMELLGSTRKIVQYLGKNEDCTTSFRQTNIHSLRPCLTSLENRPPDSRRMPFLSSMLDAASLLDLFISYRDRRNCIHSRSCFVSCGLFTASSLLSVLYREKTVRMGEHHYYVSLVSS